MLEEEGWYFPIVQRLQSDAPDSALACEPGLQSSHFVKPSVSPYLPRSQSRHEVLEEEGWYFPIVQRLQSDAPDSALACEPGLQISHFSCAEAETPSSVMKAPGEQG